jgi:hypothetical protein
LPIVACASIALVGCTEKPTSSAQMRAWYESALALQVRVSGMLAYYEASQALIQYSPDNPVGAEVCGPESVRKVVDPVVADLDELGRKAGDVGYGQNVQNAARVVGDKVRAFRAKLESYWKEASDIPGLSLPERCMHAGLVIDFRYDIDPHFATLLKEAIP